MGLTKTQSSTIDFLIELEGLELNRYLDTEGYGTIGIGHLIKPGESFPEKITRQEAIDLCYKDCRDAEIGINKVQVPLFQNQFDGLMELVFNIGWPRFIKSTLLRKINERASKKEIESAWMMWTKQPKLKGRRIKGLKKYFS